MALRINPCLLTSRAVREGDVIVCDIIEEVNFFLLQEETGCNGMNRRIAPAFIEKSTCLVERFEIIHVRLRSEPLKASNFKIRPLGEYVSNILNSTVIMTYEVTVVVLLSAIIAQETHRVALNNVLRVRLDEVLRCVPQSGDCLLVFV